MSIPPATSAPPAPAIAAHLLGVVDFESCLALQQRLVYETSGRSGGQITLLVCEHPLLVTVGRGGSRADVQFDSGKLASHKLEVRWINRGGATLLHAPGQLAIYPIVPLDWYGFTVGDYLARLQAGVAGALVEAGFQTREEPGRFGVWGRSGQLAALGVAVKSWVTYFGAYVNVCPPMQLVRHVQSDAPRSAPMSSLLVQRQHGVRMAGIRERMVRHVSLALGTDRYHIHSGHPLLARRWPQTRETTARAG